MTYVRKTGYLCSEELANLPGVPSEERLSRGPVAVVECAQNIPCNPCEDACPRGAITVGEEITSLPSLAGDRCNGCGLCVARCPGLAIFTVHRDYTETTALVSFPWEYLPLPQQGERVPCVGRDGAYRCDGIVQRVMTGKALDATAVVSVEVPKEYCMEVRAIDRGRGIHGAR